MRKNITSLSVLVLILAVNSTAVVRAQTNNIGVLLKSGAADAQTLTVAYLKPLRIGISAGLNTGWTNGAATHDPLGFDLQIRASLASVPSSDRQFNISNLTLNNLQAATPSATISPTASGKDIQGPKVIIVNNGNKVGEFHLPSGSGFHYAPAPILQLTVGMVKQTDIILRYLPKVTIGDLGSLKMKGVGLKHTFTHGSLPVNIAVLVAYSNFQVHANLDLEPDPTAAPDPSYHGNYNNQHVIDKFNTYMGRLIVGKKFPFISVYVAGGYASSNVHLQMLGDYPVVISVHSHGRTFRRTKTISDPFSYKKTINTFNFSVGFNLKLGFFRLYGQYTLNSNFSYPVLDAGIAFSFDNI